MKNTVATFQFTRSATEVAIMLEGRGFNADLHNEIITTNAPQAVVLQACADLKCTAPFFDTDR